MSGRHAAGPAGSGGRVDLEAVLGDRCGARASTRRPAVVSVARAFVLVGVLMIGACDGGGDASAPPDAAGDVVARLDATQGAEALQLLSVELGRVGLGEQEALLRRLDLRRFEHAYFLSVVAATGHPELAPRVESALHALVWPEVPADWSPADLRSAFDGALRQDFTIPYAPGLRDARRALAAHLWPRVARVPPLKAHLERAQRTPLGALVEALTADFDLRIAVAAQGEDELPAEDLEGAVRGGPVQTATVLPLTQIQAHVQAMLAQLGQEAVARLGLGLKPACGSSLTGAPALLEAQYTIERLDRFYESRSRYAPAVRMTLRVTLRAGGHAWSSGERAQATDETFAFDPDRGGLAHAVLDHVLDKHKADLLAALLEAH